ELLVHVALNEIGGAQNADRDRQIQRRPFLFHIRRREVDQGAVRGVSEAAVDDRTMDAFDALLYRRLRQPHDGRLLQASLPAIDLDLAEQRIDPQENEAMSPGQQAK